MKELTFNILDRIALQHHLIKSFSFFRNLVFLNDNGSHLNHLALSNSDDSNPNNYQFGFVSYDYKNQIEDLNSIHPDYIEFPEKHFFSPQLHFLFSEDKVVVRFDEILFTANEVERVMNECSSNKASTRQLVDNQCQLKSRLSKEEYLIKVEALKQHIQLGDIYEVNFCQEFYAEDVEVDPVVLYLELNRKSPTPFSCFVKHEDSYLMCASPERYMKKEGEHIFSQPIKGTISRGMDEKSDEQLKTQLRNDPKEQSENVMIVDLVRNDLAKVAKKNTVHVDELMGIYSFPQVHQLISTVSAKVNVDLPFERVLVATFPMGSMTGAPKIRAMELIEKYEETKRGLYSGTVGYIDPSNDFDFNVVIRSITYNAKNKYLSYMVGGAITALSNPENEYNECLLKAKAMREVLSNEVD